jgi:hypothetical protein
MNNIKFKIVRFDTSQNHEFPNKIVGFEVINENNDHSMYHEAVLQRNDILDKTNEQIIDIAFNKLSASLAQSAAKLSIEENNIVGAYYIPS